MAFVREAETESRTLGRMYLITDEQFDQVVRQERGLPAEGPRLCPDLGYMANHPKCYLNRDDPSSPLPTDSKCSYGLILNFGTEEGHPILTFSAVGPDAELPPRVPSREYLRMIALGIRETFPDASTEQTCSYYVRPCPVEVRRISSA